MSNTNMQRIHSLDLLRGFALLGILIMNIISISNIGMGYVNPTIGAGIEGYNGYFYGFAYLFADMRFMSLFSILFGAGVLLFAESIERKELSPKKYHYKRMFFLLLFGMIHAYLIWMGDILVSYAICGSIVFLMRKWRTRTIWIIGVIFFLIPVLLSLMNYAFAPPQELEKAYSFWIPTQIEIDEEIAAYTGTYMDQMAPRFKSAVQMQTFLFLIEMMWRVLSMMLLGMLLYRSKVLTAGRDYVFYKKLMVFAFAIGLLLSATGLYRSYANEWNGVWTMSVGHQYNYIASVFVALGYIGLIMMWSKSDFWTSMKLRLQAVGRLAFTNYIGTSVICTFIFYGHGLGMFGRFDRLQQWGVILLVWLIILIISPLVLKKYKQGPLEKLWRKLTYM